MKAKKSAKKRSPLKPLTVVQGSSPEHSEVALTVIEKQALCSVIRERAAAERAWQEKVKLQTEVVGAILKEYGFSDKALMDLHRIDFDGMVTITEAKKGSKT